MIPASTVTAYSASLTGGVDDLTTTDGMLTTAWALYADDAQYDISLLPLKELQNPKKKINIFSIFVQPGHLNFHSFFLKNTRLTAS